MERGVTRGRVRGGGGIGDRAALEIPARRTQSLVRNGGRGKQSFESATQMGEGFGWICGSSKNLLKFSSELLGLETWRGLRIGPTMGILGYQAEGICIVLVSARDFAH